MVRKFPIAIPENDRQAQIVKYCKMIHDAIAKELLSPDFWRTIGRTEYAMDEETLRTKRKSPLFDNPYEGSRLKIKRMAGILLISKNNAYMYPKKKKKKKPPTVSF